MTTVECITALFYEVDEQMGAIPKHPEAHLWPSEVVTLGLLHALKGVGNRACTCSLRIIPCPRKPGKMPPYHTIVRGIRHDSTPVFLPDGRLGTPMDIFHAACCLAQPMHCDTAETSGVHPTTAETLQRAEIICRPHPQAPLCAV